MVKSKADVEAKMKDRVSTAGTYLKKGMASAEDPVAKLLKDPEGNAQKMVAGLQDAVKRGNYKVGLQRAADRNSWKNSQDRAGAHFEERTGDMVKNALDSYDVRAQAIEAAQKEVASMPTATRDQRIAKSAAYQKAVGAKFDAAFGRK
jgi:hypothetical protein